MLFVFPALELNDGETTLDFLQANDVGNGQTNIDFVNVTTTTEDGEKLTTHFGIQGRSDHLADALGRRARAGIKKAVTGEAWYYRGTLLGVSF